MNTVFVLEHSYEVRMTGGEEAKLIGVYSTREKAEAAIRRLISQPGFRDYPNGFNIDEYELDEDHWSEGFVSWDEAESE